jgi:hypothetical protein
MKPLRTKTTYSVMHYGLWDRLVSSLIDRLSEYHTKRTDRLWNEAQNKRDEDMAPAHPGGK